MATTLMNTCAPPRLPFDLQLVVAENCPNVRTLLALVSSHRTLRERGARLAVQLPNARVALHTQTALRSFFEFADPLGRIEGLPSRITHLHTLDISLPIVGTTTVGGLTTMLAHVPKLASLTIREPEAALADDSLYAALQHLTTLKSLHAFGAGPTTRKLFAEVESPLGDVALTHGSDLSAAAADGPFEVEKFLARHRDTLWRVSASWAMPVDRRTAAVPENTVTPRVVFENVVDLAVPGFIWDTASDLVDTFPNVVSLDVGASITGYGPMAFLIEGARQANKLVTAGPGYDSDAEDETSDVDEEEYEREHGGGDVEMGDHNEVEELLEMDERTDIAERGGVDARNHAGEEDQGDQSDDEDDEGPFAWESLERVRGGLFDLYAFGNTCVVDVLIIDRLIQSAWRCLPAVVRDHRPRSLRLSVSSSLKVDEWERDWDKLCSVRDLYLEIDVDNVFSFDEDELADTAVRAVACFTLCRTVCLKLVGWSEATSQQLNGLDHGAFACLVFEKSRAAVKVCIHTPCMVTSWQPIVDGESLVGVQPFLSEEGNPSAEC